MTAGESLPSGHMQASSRARSSPETRTQPCRPSAASIASAIDSTSTTLFSEEQLVALSKVFDTTIFCAASSRSAVSSTIDATLPAPTPKAGVPLA
ncbi:hypothetical protein D3C83_113470 [compost metagenome]